MSPTSKLAKTPATPAESEGGWTFFTNHGHVLVCIARDPEIRIAEIARLVGIGERAAHRIVNDLVVAGYAERTKLGRRNVYKLQLDRPLRHPLEAQHRLEEVFTVFASE
jgi:predicted transcriptional regulator